MDCYKDDLEYLDKLREAIDSQRNLLDFQEHNLKMIKENIVSSGKEEIGAVVRVGDFAQMLKSRGVPYGRNKIHSWLNNRG